MLFHYVFFLTDQWCNRKLWMVKWCNREINNRSCHLFSIKYWICLFVLFSNTTFLLIIKNKQTLIRYCNASSLFFFETVILKNYVNILSIIATLLPFTSRLHRRCLGLVIVVDVSASAPHHWSRCRRSLVVITVLSFSEAASLLVDASVGFCASSLAASFHCCWRRRCRVLWKA